jgi:hypothetical protein
MTRATRRLVTAMPLEVKRTAPAAPWAPARAQAAQARSKALVSRPPRPHGSPGGCRSPGETSGQTSHRGHHPDHRSEIFPCRFKAGPPAGHRHDGRRAPSSPSTSVGRTHAGSAARPQKLGGDGEPPVALPSGRLNLLLRAIPAGRALIIESMHASPTTRTPKPPKHGLDPIQHDAPSYVLRL